MDSTAQEFSQRLKTTNKEETKVYLQMYYSGRIDRRIKQLKKRLNEKRDRYYYNTLNSAFPDEVNRSDNLPGSPTEARAISLLELHFNRKAKLWLLQEIKKLVPELEERFGQKWELIRYELGCSRYQNKQELSDNLDGFSNYKIRKLTGRGSNLTSAAVKKFEELFNQYHKKTS